MDKVDGDKFCADILKLLLEFAICAHKELLNTDGEIEYDPSFCYTPDPIDFDPANYIRFHGMTLSDSQGTYWIELATLDKLKQYLKNAGLPTIFTVLLMNEKFRKNVYIDETSDLKRLFYGCVFEKKINYEKLNKESVESALIDIDKLLLFQRIKYF